MPALAVVFSTSEATSATTGDDERRPRWHHHWHHGGMLGWRSKASPGGAGQAGPEKSRDGGFTRWRGRDCDEGRRRGGGELSVRGRSILPVGLLTAARLGSSRTSRSARRDQGRNAGSY